MPNKKISMPRIKQVLRCYAAGKGTRSISSLLDISRNTVKKYINTFNLCGKSLEEVLALDEVELLALFNEKPDPCPPPPKSDRHMELMERMPEYARMLRKKGMTKTRIFQQYRQEYPDGYMKSQFNRGQNGAVLVSLEEYNALARTASVLNSPAGAGILKSANENEFVEVDIDSL